jgi:hypothetical protein
MVRPGLFEAVNERAMRTDGSARAGGEHVVLRQVMANELSCYFPYASRAGATQLVVVAAYMRSTQQGSEYTYGGVVGIAAVRGMVEGPASGQHLEHDRHQTTGVYLGHARVVTRGRRPQASGCALTVIWAPGRLLSPSFGMVVRCSCCC